MWRARAHTQTFGVQYTICIASVSLGVGPDTRSRGHSCLISRSLIYKVHRRETHTYTKKRRSCICMVQRAVVPRASVMTHVKHSSSHLTTVTVPARVTRARTVPLARIPCARFARALRRRPKAALSEARVKARARAPRRQGACVAVAGAPARASRCGALCHPTSLVAPTGLAVARVEARARAPRPQGAWVAVVAACAAVIGDEPATIVALHPVRTEPALGAPAAILRLEDGLLADRIGGAHIEA